MTPPKCTIGMKVKYRSRLFEIIGIYNSTAWVYNADDNDDFSVACDALTPIVEPKKPSERIAEIIGKTSSDPEWQERAIDAIIQFLDELREQGKI